MAVASKLATVPFNCYELGHTWTPFCSKAALDLGSSTFKEGFKIYTSCYVISLLASRRFPKSRDDVFKIFQDIIRSSAFLSANAFGFIFFFCNIRKVKGNFNYFTMGYLPSVLAAYCAILIEKPQRRPLLALYVANVASETIYRMLRSRGLVKDIKHFDLFLFCFSIVTIIYYMKQGIRRADVVDSIFTKIFGSEEFNCKDEQAALLNLHQRRSEGGPRRVSLGGPGLRVSSGGDDNQSNSESIEQRRVRDDRYRTRFVQFVFWMHRSVEDIASHLERMVTAVYEGHIHEMCPHNSQSCFDYWFEGFCSRFLVGSGIQVGFQTAMFIKNMLTAKKPYLDKTGSLLSSSVLHTCVRSGLGLGTMCLSFRLFCCSFRWLKDMDGPGHAAASGVLASALGFFLLKPPSSLGLYLFFKAAETVISDSHRKNNWKIFQWLDKVYGGGWSILYAISTAMLFHTGMLEPQNLKPSYYHFLSRVTGRKLYEINRQLMSVYGTNGEVLMKEFWPVLNEKFISGNMKKLLKMREASGNNNEAMKDIAMQFVKSL